MVEIAISVVIGVVLLTVMVIQLGRARRREKKGAEQLRLAVAEGQTIPLSLHPVIDPALCVGSFSCIKSCPEGEIIGVVDGVATLVEAAHCIGHGRCAVECPVGAIKLVFGTAEMGIDLPKADDTFESSRPGVYIIGELGGMGLIKNALRQGLVVGQVLKDKLKKSQATETLSDVVVVGGGPAGIACAVACRQQGLDVRILEQDTLGGAIAHYPRGKVVMSEQIVMPGYGPFGRSLLSKEELLSDIRTLVENNKVHIEEGQRVTGIVGEEPNLAVVTASNASVRARAVVLAIGLRGTPRKLDVPGEDLNKVMYRLVEPEQFHSKRVLVVGGGDSAVEAAIQLAEESTAKVTISYRQGAFNRCKQRNKEKIARLIDEGRVTAMFKSRVISIEDNFVRLGPVLDEKEIARMKREEEEEKAREKREAERRQAERDRIKAEDDRAKIEGRFDASASRINIKNADSREKRQEPSRSMSGSAMSKSGSGGRAKESDDELADPDVTDPLGEKNKKKSFDKKGVTGSFRVKPILSDEGPEGTLTAPEDKAKESEKEKAKEAKEAKDAKDANENEKAGGKPKELPGPDDTTKRKRYDRNSVTGSFRALPLDAGTPARPPSISGDSQKIPRGLNDPSSSVKTVSPDDVRRRTDTGLKRPTKEDRAERAEQKKERTRTMMAPVAPVGAGAREREHTSKSTKDGETRLKNDAVIISIGGQLPTEFLKNCGVGTRQYKGEERSGVAARPGEKKKLTKAQVEARSRRRLALTLFLLGLSIMVGLVLIGQEYYWLDLEERPLSPLHPFLKPSGLWGHGVGVGATAFMMANFLYALRKRWTALKGSASIRTWLTFHMFVGIMSPLVIAFHAAFLVNNLLAVYTWVALSLVVGTGIFGRFLFSFVPAQAGKVLAVSELREKVSDLTRVVKPHMAEATDFVRVNNLFDRATEAPKERTMVGAIVRERKDRRDLEKKLDEAKQLFKEESAFNTYKKGVLEIGRAKMQLTFYGALKRVFRMWLVVHVVISLFMVVLIGAHVAVTTYLGFTWIFSDAP